MTAKNSNRAVNSPSSWFKVFIFRALHTCFYLFLALSFSLSAQEIQEVTVQAEIQDDAVLDDLVSVSSLSAEKLADAGIANVEDVAAYVPNLVLTQTETGTSIVIRGIGAGVNQGFDQSVGLYIDGIPLPRANMARAPFLDLSSVQVLRGPQYVLDGSFSIAGSVHMQSELSTEEFGAGIDFNYVPSQNAQSMLLTLGGPVSDKFAARVAIQAKSSDGYIENVTRNEGNESNDLIGRLVLGFNPTDSLSFKFKIEEGSFDTIGRAVEIIYDEPTPDLTGIFSNKAGGEDIPLIERQAGGQKITTEFLTEADYILTALRTSYRRANGIDPNGGFAYSNYSYLGRLASIYTNPYDQNPNDGNAPIPAPVPAGLLDNKLNYKRGADLEEFSHNDTTNYTLNAEYWFGEHKFSSASSYIEYEFDEQIDSDFTAAPLLKTVQHEEYEQIFQRLDYISPEDNFIQIKAGVSYLNSKLLFEDRTDMILSEKNSVQPFPNTPTYVANIEFDPQEVIRQYFGLAGFESALLGFETYAPDRQFEQDTETTAAYINATLNWTDTFRSHVGLRYTHSQKEAIRDLAFLGENGEIPTTSISDDGERVFNSNALRDMFKQYLGLFGVQGHTDRYPTSVDIGNQGVGALKGSRREEILLPSITLEWDINDDISTFISARMANKLGGFDARANTTPDVVAGAGAPAGTFEFEDEHAISYELGAKWYLPYGLGEMSAIAFYTDYKDLQLSRFDGKSGFNVDNAGAANTKGVEIEGLIQITDQFNINYSLAWIDFTFEDFEQGTCHLNERPDHFIFAVQTNQQRFGLDGTEYVRGDAIPILYEGFTRGPAFGTGPSNINNAWLGSPGDPIGVDLFDDTQLGAPAFCDFKGKTNQYVAEWQGTFTFNYESEIRNLGLIKPSLDVLYNSGYFASVSQDPVAAQDAYVQFNGRLALVSFEDTWTVALTGQNLTNVKIVSYANDTPLGARFQGARGFTGFIRPPRTIGLNLRYNFY